MKILVQSPHFRASKTLTDLVKEKVKTLEKLEDEIDRADVTLTLGRKGSNLGQTCQILLSVRGKDVFAKVNANSFDEAVNQCLDVVRRRLRKRKTKKMILEFKNYKYKSA